MKNIVPKSPFTNDQAKEDLNKIKELEENVGRTK